MRISFSNISVVNPTNRRIKPHHILSFVNRNGYKPVHVKDGDLVLVAGPIFEGDDLGLPLFARNLNAKINLLPIRVQEMTSKNLALQNAGRCVREDSGIEMLSQNPPKTSVMSSTNLDYGGEMVGGGGDDAVSPVRRHQRSQVARGHQQPAAGQLTRLAIIKCK